MRPRMAAITRTLSATALTLCTRKRSAWAARPRTRQAIVPASRSAGTGKPDVAKDPFSQLDADGDGQVTKSELEATATGAATSSYDVMNQMIARQMQAFATSSSAWMKF